MFFFNFFFIFNFFAIFPINFGYQKRKKSKFSKALSEAENEFAFFVFFTYQGWFYLFLYCHFLQRLRDDREAASQVSFSEVRCLEASDKSLLISVGTELGLC